MVNPNKPLHISIRVLSSSPCIDLATYLCTLSDNKRSVLFNIHSSHPKELKPSNYMTVEKVAAYILYIYTYTCTCIYIYIYVKPPDEYPWQGRNSFNSGIFVIFKKLWTLNYRSPLLSSQFLPALKWLLKSSLTVYIFFGLYPCLIVRI